MPRINSLKMKIILSCVACILVVGIISNVYLFSYLTGIISEKADHIDQMQLNTLQALLNQRLEEMQSLGNLCTYDLGIARGMRNQRLFSLSEKKEVLSAQEVLQRYLSAHNGIEPYVNRLMAFNDYGVRAQAVVREINTMEDVARVRALPAFEQLLSSSQAFMTTISPSIVDGSDCLIYLGRIYEVPGLMQRGYLYIELSPQLFSDVLAPYGPSNLFIAREDGSSFPANSSHLPEPLDLTALASQHTFSFQGSVYKFNLRPLKSAGLTLYSKADITYLSTSTSTISYTAIVVVFSSLAVAVILAILLSGIITKPLRRLTARLRRATENDFSFDPDIERGGGEIAEMGRVVNEMTQSINTLLKETEQMHLQQKNAEIALLQSQVNPHFLYNTLDSIRWMAVIQKNPGIEKTVRSLSNLLKNLAKGTSDKIPLENEIALLMDYVDTQSVRFMDLLEVRNNIPPALLHYNIVKFTLQPLVENAIFHGIEPSGECGVIELNAYEEGDYLIITVEDNGVGMTDQELKALQSAAQNPNPHGMAGIGVANVDNRLKLVYGGGCGLTFESGKGSFTRVSVRIRKESAIPCTE